MLSIPKKMFKMILMIEIQYCLLIMIIAGTQINKQFTYYPQGHGLSVTLQQYTPVSILDCAAACMRCSNCSGFNYRRHPDKNCQLMGIPKSLNNLTSYDTTFVYYHSKTSK